MKRQIAQTEVIGWSSLKQIIHHDRNGENENL